MVSDALAFLGIKRGVISPCIKQLVLGTRIAEPAFTVATPGSVVVPCLEALDKISKGDILVIDTGVDTIILLSWGANGYGCEECRTCRHRHRRFSKGY